MLFPMKSESWLPLMETEINEPQRQIDLKIQPLVCLNSMVGDTLSVFNSDGHKLMNSGKIL